MKEVFALIEKEKEEFTHLPFFKFLQNENIELKQRLAWVPCFAPLAMSFGDLWKYVFRKEPAGCIVQEIINNHTYEDENHNKWFPEDIEELGFENSLNFSDSLNFLWGQETEKTRWVCQQIAIDTFSADPIIVLVAIEAIEAIANITFFHTMQITQQLQKATGRNYRYFGDEHFNADDGHTTSLDVEKLIGDIQLTPEQQVKAFEIIEKVFAVFRECYDELMIYAKKHSNKQPQLLPAA
jgi:hypothetical protein